MGKPFKVTEIAAKNTNERKPPVAPLPGKAIVHSETTGDPLPDGSKDTAHESPIPWPQPARGVDHTPFKNTK